MNTLKINQYINFKNLHYAFVEIVFQFLLFQTAIHRNRSCQVMSNEYVVTIEKDN
jgi:hypothetical protein